MSKFVDIMSNYNLGSIPSSIIIEAMEELHPIFDNIEKQDTTNFWKAMRGFHEKLVGPHFDETYAKYQVDNMYHTERNGTVCKGEIYSISEAKKVYEKYIKPINSTYTCWDIYVALNAQYHDYAKMYKSWYGNITDEDLNNKIISSAVTFWFKDEDAGCGKVWNYFK